MKRITGREAVSVLAEVEAEKVNLKPYELAYCQKQAEGFKKWLIRQGKTDSDAQDIIDRIIASEVKLLLQDDPFEDLIWSRDGEVGDLELDIASSLGNDFEKCSNLEFRSHQGYWESMEFTAERHIGHYPDEVWRASQDKLDQIMDSLKKLKNDLFGKLLSSKDRILISKIKNRITELRFGKCPLLKYRHWAIAMNEFNKITNNPKQYPVSEIKDRAEEQEVRRDSRGVEEELGNMRAVYSLSLDYDY